MHIPARIVADLPALNRAATEATLQAITASLRETGKCCVALAGGHTPEQMYRLWATEYSQRFPWQNMQIFWGDERYVPPSDPRSNYGMAREALLDLVPIPKENIHPMATTLASPSQAAAAYERTLRQYVAERGAAFDVVFLGLGPEGHTASLFPNSGALAETERWVVDAEVPAQPPLRLTLTVPLLNRSRHVFFLVAGAEKRQILFDIYHDPSAAARFPAARIRPQGQLLWFLDQAAAAGILPTASATVR